MMAPGPLEAAFQRRALLGLLPDGPSSSTSAATAETTAAAAAATGTATSSDSGLLGGLNSVVGGVTSAVGGVVSSILPTPTSSTTTSKSTTSTTSSTTSSTSSTSSTTTSSSSSSSSSSSVSTPTSTPSPDSAPQSTSQSESLSVSTSGNQLFTVTATLPASSSAAPTAAQAPKSFLENKPLSGTIFALAGVVGLVILIIMATWFMRRSRKNRLEADAENFNDAFRNPDFSNAGGMGGAFPSEKIERTASGRTARSNGSASDEALIGGYGHTHQSSDGIVTQENAPPMQQQQQPGARGFTALPAPPGLTGPRAHHPGVPANSYAYDNPYDNGQRAAYPAYQPGQYANGAPPAAFAPQQPAQPLQRLPTNISTRQPQPQPQPQTPQGPPSSQAPQLAYAVGADARYRANTPSPTDGRPSSHANTFGNGSAEDARNSGDVYADYAFATGPGQQGNAPRNLTIANA